jgi:Mn2+/Fe2+ NRAMP family transporter
VSNSDLPAAVPCPGRPGHSRCQTASVSYHHDFWVTIGTAAPVIALATVVSAADVSRAAERFAIPDDFADLDALSAGDRRAGLILYWCFVTTISAVLWSQIYAITAALQSPMQENDRWSMTSLVIIEPVAFFLLFFAGAMNYQLRVLRGRLETPNKTQGNEAAGPATKPSLRPDRPGPHEDGTG